MRNVFVRTDFRVLHRRAESVGRSDRPANRGFRPLVVVQQREQRGLTLRQASLSIRDIGSALGLSRGTVQRELDAADPASLPDTIVGADGKERPASNSTVSVDDSEATVPNGTVDPETTGSTVTETPVTVDNSDATVPNGTVDPETSVTVDDSEKIEAHRVWLAKVVAGHRKMKTELAEAKAKWTEEDREKNRKHKEKGGCERCLETPQRLLLSAVFDAVLFDGVTDLDQVAADNHIDPMSRISPGPSAGG